MKVSLISLLALASSAWAKDSTSTVVNKGKGSNLNYDRNRKLSDKASAPTGGKAGKSDECGITDPADRGFVLGLLANALVQQYGRPSPTVSGTFVLMADSAELTVVETIYQGILIEDIDDNLENSVAELTIGLVEWYDGKCLDHLIVGDAGVRAVGAIPVHFGYFGVTAALVFANIGAAY